MDAVVIDADLLAAPDHPTRLETEAASYADPLGWR
jgi:hypothetical protein